MGKQTMTKIYFLSGEAKKFITLCCGIVFFIAGVAVAQTPSPSAKPTTAEGWQALTMADLAAMEKTIRDNTPIALDTENPELSAWLMSGFTQARSRAATVTDEAGWFYTLAAFANGFRDPHVNVGSIGELPAPRSPGFVVSALGENAVVVANDDADSQVSVGTIITACDGMSLKALAAARVFPFVMNPALPADARRAVTRLFLDRGNPFALAPATCDIATNGEKKTIALKWRPIPTTADAQKIWFQQFQNASVGATPDFAVSEPAPGVTWISVPTFQSGKETAPKLTALIEDVKKRGNAMRQGQAILIDTRGNGGGNSAWARKLAEAIFTKEILKTYATPETNSGTDWRASVANSRYWREWEQQMAREFGSFSESRLFAQHIAANMESALEAGNPFYRQGADKTGKSGGLTQKRPTKDAKRPFPAAVYFLSNGSCGSSCLNFADTVLFVPGVKLIGQATSADGMLMDVRSETLPSGYARFTPPQKIARGRARGNLEFYPADIAYDGAWDDASVRAWVMKLVMEEAARSNK
jgi:hypothetical protein